MQWSPQQDKVLKAVGAWIKNPDGKQLYRLFGYAGTGKTTLAKHLAEDVDGTTLFAAYTGKAASVLRNSGCGNARTLHSLIYRPKPRSAARLRELELELSGALDGQAAFPENFEPHVWDAILRLMADIEREKLNSKRPNFELNLESDLATASLLVVDECSMVDEQMALDIMSFNVPVLVLGDPAQLPPVFGAGYFTNVQPDTMLTEIHRQARDNPIIQMATTVREGGVLALGQYGDSRVIARADPETAMAADQVLVGKNKTRMASNRRIRQLKGIDNNPWPVDGERLVCLRNSKEPPLLNGTLHRTVGDSRQAGEFINIDVVPEDGGETILVSCHPEHFVGDPDSIGNWNRLDAQEFTFGYALTVHKAQGSQWNNVLLFDEWRQVDTRKQWLYTAITRAAERITVVRG